MTAQHYANRARKGAEQQERLKEAFAGKVSEMRDATDRAIKHVRIDELFSSADQSSALVHPSNVTVARPSDGAPDVSTAADSSSFGEDSIYGLQTYEQYRSKMEAQDSGDANSQIGRAVGIFRDKRLDPQTTIKESSSKSGLKDSSSPSLKSRKRKLTAMLSFGNDSSSDSERSDETCEDGISRLSQLKKPRKNPRVNSEFLNDEKRAQKEAKLRDELLDEWNRREEMMKKEQIKVIYSFWNGSGHRYDLTVNKGCRMLEFLNICLSEQLSHDFKELKFLSGAQLMYIKDDMIVPHDVSFYDLIVTEARGQKGLIMPLDNVTDEYGIPTDGGYPGKIVTRTWYDRNKHIYPASNWKVYDPASASHHRSLVHR